MPKFSWINLKFYFNAANEHIGNNKKQLNCANKAKEWFQALGRKFIYGSAQHYL